MTRADLLALADRVEREGPSRALRYEIAEALGLSVDPAPRMLDSLDAAASLMPKGWLLMTASDIAGDGTPYVRLVNPDTDGDVHGLARTLQQAWAAAALRAIAMEMKDE